MKMVKIPYSLCTTAGLGSSGEERRFTLGTNATETVLFPVIPLDVGDIELTVQLISFGFVNIGDQVTQVLKVEV